MFDVFISFIFFLYKRAKTRKKNTSYILPQVFNLFLSIYMLITKKLNLFLPVFVLNSTIPIYYNFFRTYHSCIGPNFHIFSSQIVRTKHYKQSRPQKSLKIYKLYKHVHHNSIPIHYRRSSSVPAIIQSTFIITCLRVCIVNFSTLEVNIQADDLLQSLS